MANTINLGTDTAKRSGRKPEHDADEYLTDPQLGSLLDVTGRTTSRWRRDGNGPPFVRVGKRRILYRRADVDRWLADRTFPHRAAEANALWTASGAASA
jgi:predicted DNA-binding transcriptional regulator AlpA